MGLLYLFLLNQLFHLELLILQLLPARVVLAIKLLQGPVEVTAPLVRQLGLDTHNTRSSQC